jgi:hypothetical protein
MQTVKKGKCIPDRETPSKTKDRRKEAISLVKPIFFSVVSERGKVKLN